jgi:hypothetical protein
LIDICLVRTNDEIAAATPTMAYDIYVGTPGSEAVSAFSGVPSAVSRVALGSGAWALLHRVNDSWELVPYANHCYHVTLGVAIGAGATGSVSLPDGRVVTAKNWSADTTLTVGDKCQCFQDLTDGLWYLVKTGSATKIWHSLAIDDIAAGATGTVELSTGGEVEATNWSDDVGITGSVEGGDKIHVYQDPFDSAYYAIKSGGGGGVVLCRTTLNTLSVSDTTGTTASDMERLDTGEVLESTGATVDNPLGLACVSGGEAIIAVDNTSGSANGYTIMQVQHISQATVINSLVDSTTNTSKIQQRKRTLGVMSDGNDDSDTTTVVDLQLHAFLTSVAPDSGSNTTALQSSLLAVKGFPTTGSVIGPTTWLSLATKTFVIDVEDSGTALTKDTISCNVFPCTAAETSGTSIVATTDCS